jgi:hypothetical protein
MKFSVENKATFSTDGVVWAYLCTVVRISFFLVLNLDTQTGRINSIEHTFCEISSDNFHLFDTIWLFCFLFVKFSTTVVNCNHLGLSNLFDTIKFNLILYHAKPYCGLITEHDSKVDRLWNFWWISNSLRSQSLHSTKRQLIKFRHKRWAHKGFCHLLIRR